MISYSILTLTFILTHAQRLVRVLLIATTLIRISRQKLYFLSFSEITDLNRTVIDQSATFYKPSGTDFTEQFNVLRTIVALLLAY